MSEERKPGVGTALITLFAIPAIMVAVRIVTDTPSTPDEEVLAEWFRNWLRKRS